MQCMAGARGRASHGRIAVRILPAQRLPRLTEAHCKVATHYPLLPSPYSLPIKKPLLRWEFPIREGAFFNGVENY